VTKWFGSTRSGEESNVLIGDRIVHASLMPCRNGRTASREGLDFHGPE